MAVRLRARGRLAGRYAHQVLEQRHHPSSIDLWWTVLEGTLIVLLVTIARQDRGRRSAPAEVPGRLTMVLTSQRLLAQLADT